MSAFIDYLANYVRSELRNALEAARGSRELRVFFSGPPLGVLNKLFDALIQNGNDLRLEVHGREFRLPVFVLDAAARDPDVLRSARCTPSYLVKVRTSECPVFLALHPPGESTVLSLESARDRFGVTDVVEDAESWLGHRLVNSLVNEGITRLFKGSSPDGAMNVFLFALKEAWQSDERHKDRRHAWALLQRLLDHGVDDLAPHEVMAAILGLPTCTRDEFGTTEHLKLLGRLADILENTGLNPAFDMLEEQADDELRPHVAELRKQMLTRCKTATDYASAPLRNYMPFDGEAFLSPPAWWRALTLEAWHRLLDTSPEEKPQNGLQVRCIAALTPSVRGMPIILRNDIEVDIAVTNATSPLMVKITRASGGKKLEEVDTIEVAAGEPFRWKDDNVPVHDRYVRYRFEAEGYTAANQKFIVLDRYVPGVALYTRSADKITPFTLNRRARDQKGQRIERFECQLSLHGIGTHQLDLYMGKQVQLDDKMVGHEVNAEQDGSVERPINGVDEHHAVCVIETDEDCYYDFEADSDGSGSSRLYRVWVEADEQLPTGAGSEFERLVIEHRVSARGERVNARVEPATSRATDLQIWAIDSDDSFHPLVLGPDYLTRWRKPSWAERPILSNHHLMLDPRPPISEFQPPSDLLEARRYIRTRLRPQQDEPTNPVEMAQLGELMQDDEFRTSVTRYLLAYLDWLASDYSAAVWMDVVSLHQCESNGNTLHPSPYAILLAPLHPLRLAWQCQAQRVLKDALDNGARCPAASMLDPCSFPDCLNLPCRTAGGRLEERIFIALANTSDYWGVLWSKECVTDLGVQDKEAILDRDFGILAEGLATGFSEQQVVRSISEVARLASAKSTLRVSVSSDTTGSSSCNEGIDQWCTDNLGPDHDEWHTAGPTSLHVHDRRHESLHPEQAVLASLTSRTGAAVRWFTQSVEQDKRKADLSIVAQLGTANPSFQVENLRSAVDPSSLARWRVRKQLAPSNGIFIAESRISSVPPVEDRDSLPGLLLRCVDKLETRCADLFDSYVFAPSMRTLEDALGSANYCAVSSSTVDAACFFRATDKSYLWDYELPSYGRRAGESSGYFLLARESLSMGRAVQSAVKKIAPTSELSAANISSLLREISKRGMPTLKRLTGGGATSLGEIGMLVALRILQSEFEDQPRGPGLAPVRLGEDVLNLVIPADPFKDQFEDLRAAIQKGSGERPDLIVASVRFVAGAPRKVRLTPIEVKARGSMMTQAERQSALGQATSFSKFLSDVKQRSAEFTLWGIAWRSMVASWLDYAFRVYGQLDVFLRQEQWAGLHGEVLNKLMSGDLEAEVDQHGRLIVVDGANHSAPVDVDGDGFHETVVLSYKDAYSVLVSDDDTFLAAIRDRLNGWQLSPLEDAAGSGDSDEPPSPRGSTSPAVAKGSEAQSLKDTAPREFPGRTESADMQEIGHEEPDAPAGIKFQVGRSLDGFQKRDLFFFPGNTSLNQLNVGIVGDLGTGKTQLVQALIHQLRRRPEDNRGKRPRVLVFDYKKDYSKPEFLKDTGARVVSPFDIPLNLFDTRDCAGRRNIWLERSKFFSDVLDKIYSGIGPVQRDRIKQAVRFSYEQAAASGREAPTVYDVFDAYKGICGKTIDSPYTIMSDIVDGGHFVRDTREVLPFSEFLDGIVVVDLGAVGSDDRTKNMLVVVFLNLFYEYMLRITKEPFLGKEPKLRYIDTMLLIDEADNIMKYEFDVLNRVLLQGREFGVGVILASQYLSHFRTEHENYAEPLLTWFVHKVPNITIKELQGIGLTRVDGAIVDRIKSLACHECLYKTYDVGGDIMRATPFYEIAEGKD